jgi:hypothetical protein
MVGVMAALVTRQATRSHAALVWRPADLMMGRMAALNSPYLWCRKIVEIAGQNSLRYAILTDIQFVTAGKHQVVCLPITNLN